MLSDTQMLQFAQRLAVIQMLPSHMHTGSAKKKKSGDDSNTADE